MQKAAAKELGVWLALTVRKLALLCVLLSEWRSDSHASAFQLQWHHPKCYPSWLCGCGLVRQTGVGAQRLAGWQDSHCAQIWECTLQHFSGAFSLLTHDLSPLLILWIAIMQWVNGKFVVSHEGGHLPFEGDVTKFVQWDTSNTITVAVNNTLTPHTIPPGTF